MRLDDALPTRRALGPLLVKLLRATLPKLSSRMAVDTIRGLGSGEKAPAMRAVQTSLGCAIHR